MRAEEILERGLALLKSKGEDYTEDRDVNQYQNFERSNLIASWFKYDEDKSFAVLIGTKLARLATLLNSNKGPNNESILDSFIDGSNYFALWGGKRASKPGTKPYESHEEHTKIRNEYQASKPAEDQPSRPGLSPLLDSPLATGLEQTSPACAFCKRPIDRNNIRYIGFHGKEAHISCYNHSLYESKLEFATGLEA